MAPDYIRIAIAGFPLAEALIELAGMYRPSSGCVVGNWEASDYARSRSSPEFCANLCLRFGFLGLLGYVGY